MTKKLNVRSYLVDNTLDLSMNDLQDVPVKEIASCPKATILDLSNNKIITLGKLFPSTLNYLVKLDLSSNQLTSLPDNFGLLAHLRHLDLYHNKITELPLSFGNLKMLRWLDLKDNPLEPKLAAVSGPCLDAQQCQMAAKCVVTYLDRALRLEQEKQKELEAKKLLEEKEKAAAKSQSTQSKKKKKKNKNPNKEEVSEKSEANSLEADTAEEEQELLEDIPTSSPRKRSRIGAFCSSVIKMTVFTVLVAFLLVFIVSILDETTYNKTNAKVSKMFRYIYSKIFTKEARRTLTKPFHYLEIKLAEIVPQCIELYAEVTSVVVDVLDDCLYTLADYWHIAYITFVEFADSFSGSGLPSESA